MPNPFTRVLTWLRAGYPQGVPPTDYVALYGLLHRSLTDQEIEDLVVQLSRGDEGVTDEQVREALRRHVHQEPTKEDVMRVLQRVEAANWPTGEIPVVTDEAPHA